MFVYFPEMFFSFFVPPDEFVLDDLKKIFGEKPAKSSGIKKGIKKCLSFFEPYQEGRTLAKSVRRNLRDRCLKRTAFLLVSCQ